MIDSLITIILPIYKVEKYLAKSIESVINQSYKNLEIILVDDGSPDTCGKICDLYAEKDSRIKVVHKENGGLSSARNSGLDIATGEYICFIDSDDYVDSQYIERLYNEIKSGSFDLVACDFEYVYEKDNSNKKSGLVEKDITIEGREKIISHLLGNKYYLLLTVAWNKIYKRDLFESLRYTNGIIHEDEDIAYKILHKCNNVKIIKDSLYFYLQRESSIMGGSNVDKRSIIIDIYKKRHQFLVENKYSSKILNLSYYKYLMNYRAIAYQYYINNNYQKKILLEQQWSKEEKNNRLKPLNLIIKYNVKKIIYKLKTCKRKE